LRRSWREAAHVDREAAAIGEALELPLPHARPVRVASAGVCREEELGRVRVALLAHQLPPRGDRRHGEYRRVVVRADVDESAVVDDVVDAVGDRLPDGVAREIVYVDELRFVLRLPLDAFVPEIANEL